MAGVLLRICQWMIVIPRGKASELINSVRVVDELLSAKTGTQPRYGLSRQARGAFWQLDVRA